MTFFATQRYESLEAIIFISFDLDWRHLKRCYERFRFVMTPKLVSHPPQTPIYDFEVFAILKQRDGRNVVIL